MFSAPSYDGLGLVNLMAEIEAGLIGTSQTPRLDSDLSSALPESPTVVLVLFDGLGTAQLAHEGAAVFRSSLGGTLEAGFPTTTSTSLATIATGLPPGQHGVIGHLVWMPGHDRVVNTLKWVDLAGDPVSHDFSSVLPGPNLWERLRAGGIEPITVQPGDFSVTPLTRVLYRGARFEGVWGTEDLIEATVQLSAVPGRFILAYVPEVDFAGHVFGLGSAEFDEAVRLATRVWEGIVRRVGPGVTVLGTADHGLVEYPEESKLLIREPRFAGLRFAGDPRGLHMWSGQDDAVALAELTGGTLVDPASLYGPAPSSSTLERIGDHLLMAPEGNVLLPPAFDKRLLAYHGGTHPSETEIPLLIG